MNIKLDEKLKQLKTLEDQIALLENKKEAIRKETMSIIETETDGQYKNEIATVSKTERKTIKFIKSSEDIVKEIEDMNLPKYLELIKEEIIPEHYVLNEDFDSDIKDGIFKLEGVEVETKENIAIRFNKLNK